MISNPLAKFLDMDDILSILQQLDKVKGVGPERTSVWGNIYEVLDDCNDTSWMQTIFQIEEGSSMIICAQPVHCLWQRVRRHIRRKNPNKYVPETDTAGYIRGDRPGILTGNITLSDREGRVAIKIQAVAGSSASACALIGKVVTRHVRSLVYLLPASVGLSRKQVERALLEEMKREFRSNAASMLADALNKQQLQSVLQQKAAQCITRAAQRKMEAAARAAGAGSQAPQMPLQAEADAGKKQTVALTFNVAANSIAQSVEPSAKEPESRSAAHQGQGLTAGAAAAAAGTKVRGAAAAGKRTTTAPGRIATAAARVAGRHAEAAKAAAEEAAAARPAAAGRAAELGSSCHGLGPSDSHMPDADCLAMLEQNVLVHQQQLRRPATRAATKVQQQQLLLQEEQYRSWQPSPPAAQPLHGRHAGPPAAAAGPHHAAQMPASCMHMPPQQMQQEQQPACISRHKSGKAGQAAAAAGQGAHQDAAEGSAAMLQEWQPPRRSPFICEDLGQELGRGSYCTAVHQVHMPSQQQLQQLPHDCLLTTLETISTMGPAAAVKVISRSGAVHGGGIASYQECYAALVQEARAMLQLHQCGSSSVHLVRGIAFLTDGKQCQLLMQLLPGAKTISVLVQERGRALGMLEVLQIGEQLVLALQELHAAGVVHRDLSGNNAVVRQVPGKGGQPPAWNATLLDYGSSVVVAQEQQQRQQRQQPAMVTPAFQAPELRCYPPVPPAPALDVYSLACLMAYMATGEAPYSNGAVHLPGVVPVPQPGGAPYEDSTLKALLPSFAELLKSGLEPTPSARIGLAGMLSGIKECKRQLTGW